jgi:hypothetical protein
VITRILLFVAVAGAVLGLFVLLSADLLGSETQAIDIAFAIAYAVIPYCLARAWQEIGRSG